MNADRKYKNMHSYHHSDMQRVALGEDQILASGRTDDNEIDQNYLYPQQ